jgi:hypothetical protein
VTDPFGIETPGASIASVLVGLRDEQRVTSHEDSSVHRHGALLEQEIDVSYAVPVDARVRTVRHQSQAKGLE